MTFATCDLCDAHENLLTSGHLQIVDPGYLQLGKRPRFAGPAYTLQVFEDNALVRSALEQPGEGRVLVVDGGGSRRCALIGGNLATLAAQNGWSGVVVHGCVRDNEELQTADIGLRALALYPRKSAKQGAGEMGLALHFSGVCVHPGAWVYADQDGILVASQALSTAA